MFGERILNAWPTDYLEAREDLSELFNRVSGYWSPARFGHDVNCLPLASLFRSVMPRPSKPKREGSAETRPRRSGTNIVYAGDLRGAVGARITGQASRARRIALVLKREVG